MRTLRVRALVFCLAVLSVTACGGGDGGGGGGGSPITPASIEIVAGDGQTAVIGTELPTAVSVRVLDGASRGVNGVTVAWNVATGGGSVNPTSGTTDTSGMASARWTLGTTPGLNNLTATVAGLPAVTFRATAVLGDATASVTVTSPTLLPYEGDTVQLTAIARDSYGNALPSKVATWSSSNPVIAPISESGLLQAWGTGEVTASATVDGIVGTATLTLTPIRAAVTAGGKEIVFDWTTDRCEDLDLPDQPPRIVRAGDGDLVMFAGNAPRYYVSRGTNFGSIRRDCRQPALESAPSPAPEDYQGFEWIWSIYREGALWHGLVLNEWYDAVAATCQPGDFSPGNPCVYNSITHAVSSDGAHSFSKPLAPAHTIAPPPQVWVPPAAAPKREGYVLPTNLVRRDDGYYYAMIQGQGACLVRTRTLEDPSTWRAWDGNGFTQPLPSPYVTGASGEYCRALPQPVGVANLYYSTYLERYITVINASSIINGRLVCGFYFQLSADLIHWSQNQLLVETSLQDCHADPTQPGVLETAEGIFPALVDHDDTTLNFEQVGRTPHLYFVRFTDGNLDRDVIRAPLTFTRTN